MDVSSCCCFPSSILANPTYPRVMKAMLGPTLPILTISSPSWIPPRLYLPTYCRSLVKILYKTRFILMKRVTGDDFRCLGATLRVSRGVFGLAAA